ncbi:hypothetical protein HU200_047989 [Digitaria exilis]|uniref:NADP-dependent oxidoreductase domain-containing protein n=1 Tax=Digitaria exilis TaxID=1010633 RepID=A0A835AW64_9POAL|nr:hypothetical protein HU200_047989 [Digitaria exilis]
MPRVGLGTATATFATAEGHTGVKEAVLHAIGAGYRHFDTAAVYNTEAALGDAVAEAVRAGTIASRDVVYVTSKLWITDAHPGRVLPALEKTLRNLCMEYVDLYLIHHPVSQRPPKDDGNMVLVKEDLVEMDMKGVWEEMEECQRRGLAKAIGVSNFACKKLENLLSFANIPPVVNQVEVNPYCRQKKLREFCRARGIQLCGYSPLGANGATAWANSSVMESPVLKQIAQDRCKSVAQVCIRWVYEQGDVVIVKSFNESRMRENLDIFDWELTDDDRRKISELPESRGLYNFLVHESGPYRTVEELWDGEITAGHCNQTTFVSSG